MIRRAALLALALLAGACTGGGGTPLERGRAAYAAGDLRTARVELLNAIKADPRDLVARLLQAEVHLGLGDGVAAEAEVMRARAAGASAADTAHLLAHARLLQGDPRGALAEAEAAAPAHAAYAARMRGRARAALGDFAAARTELQRAVAAAPDDAAAWTDLGRLRRDDGDLRGAIEAADRAVAADPASAEALTLRGELTRTQYGLAAALPWFDQALAAEPDNVTTLLERAITNGDLGRGREMLADARRVHALTGGHPMAYYLQAVLAARARRYALARDILAHTRGAFDDTPAGMLLKGGIELQTGNAEQAARRLSRLVALQPDNRKARRLLAAAQFRAGDAAATIDTLLPIAELPDADAYSLSLIGRALERRGDRRAAAFYLARAARPVPPARAALARLDEGEFARLAAAAGARPGDAALQLRYATALLARGDTGAALDRARRIQAANPGAAEPYVLIGDALGVAGNHQAAAEQYRRAANLAFSESVAIRLIGALDRSGRGAEADGVLRLFVSQNPRSVPGLILLAGRAMQAGEWERAATLYETLRERLGDNDATVLNNLALAYAEMEAPERGLPYAYRAWSLDPDNPATTDTLGWLLYRSGRRAEGLALLQRALRGAPSDADIQRRLDLAARR